MISVFWANLNKTRRCLQREMISDVYLNVDIFHSFTAIVRSVCFAIKNKINFPKKIARNLIVPIILLFVLVYSILKTVLKIEE